MRSAARAELLTAEQLVRRLLWLGQVIEQRGCDGGASTCLATHAACGASACATCCNGDICQNAVCGPGIN